MRHGSRIAASPPGSGTGSRWAIRSNETRSQRRSSPPQSVPSVPIPVPSRTTASASPVSPCSARQAAAWAWWCCTSTSGQPLLAGPLRRQVLGMKVARDRRGLDTEHVEVEREVGAERAVGGLAVEIAEVRGEEGLGAAGDAERALQLGPRGDDRRRRRDGERQRPRRVAPRASHRERGADDRVLAAAMDRPVVGEERIGDLAQPAAGVLVVDRDRLVGAVAARQHERPADLVTEEVVERGVGQHQRRATASPLRPMGQQGRRPGPGRARSGVRAPCEERVLCGRQLGELVRSGGHHRERLLLAELPARAGGRRPPRRSRRRRGGSRRAP